MLFLQDEKIRAYKISHIELRNLTAEVSNVSRMLPRCTDTTVHSFAPS